MVISWLDALYHAGGAQRVVLGGDVTVDLARNLQTCRGCRSSHGVIDPPMGVRLCPVDGATCLSHAETGNTCKKGLHSRSTPSNAPAAKPERPKGGPGTELKKMLAKIGIVASPSCRCNAVAAMMDLNGGPWCLDNIDMMVDTMRSEAARRRLPFLSAVAKGMVRRAVRNAQRTT